MKIISIDPGLCGVLTWMTEEGPQQIVDLPFVPWGGNSMLDVDEVRNLLSMSLWVPDVVVIERVGVAPNDGKTQAANFMRNFGALVGACAGYRRLFIQPSHWKTYSGLIGEPKKASVGKALKYYPAAERFLTGHKNAVDRADAILIGRYAIEIKLRGDENADKRQ